MPPRRPASPVDEALPTPTTHRLTKLSLSELEAYPIPGARHPILLKELETTLVLTLFVLKTYLDDATDGLHDPILRITAQRTDIATASHALLSAKCDTLDLRLHDMFGRGIGNVFEARVNWFSLFRTKFVAAEQLRRVLDKEASAQAQSLDDASVIVID